MAGNREQLSWAGGFFVGEGTFGCYRNHKSLRVSCTITQFHREPLDRFQKAVWNLGAVGGPYVNKRGKQFWNFRAHSFEHVQAIIAALWPFLDHVKQEQATRALRKFHGR